MRNKLKIFIVCLLLTVTVFVEPVSYAFAGGASNPADRANTVPKVSSSEVKFTVNEFFDWFGLVKVPEEKIYKDFVLTHSKSDNLDYEIYDLVCEFEFNTMDVYGNVTTSNYSYTIDFSYFDIDNDLVFNDVYKSDGSVFFKHEFTYKNIVNKAKGYKEYPIAGKKNCYTCNTVISQADFYYVRKSDGKAGPIARYKFTWDSDFKKQICKKIETFYVNQSSGGELETGKKENAAGVIGSSDEEKTLDFSDIMSLLYEVPAALVAIVVGFIDLVMQLSGLFKLVFPFIPGMVFDIFAIFMLLLFVVFVWKIVFDK